MRRSLAVLTLWIAVSFAVGQTLTTAIGSDPATLDPHLTLDEFAFHVTNHVYETLVRLTPEGDIVPSLASSWSYPNATTLRLELRHGVTFHDGEALDATAVVASLERLRDPATDSPGRFLLSYVREVRAVDSDTVDVVTESRFAPLLAHLAHPAAAIVPVARAATLGREPVGTGPFEFVHWVDGREVLMVANQSYWGGAPELAEVVIRILPDAGARVLELRSGGAEMVFDVPADDHLRLAADPAIVAIAIDGWCSVRLVFNLDRPELADLRVRQALAHAIDKDRMVAELLAGLARPAVSPLPDGVRFASDLSEPYPYDPDTARSLLADAGVVGLRLRLDLIDEPELAAIARMLRSAFADVGVELELRVQDSASWVRSVEGDDAELMLVIWDAPTFDAHVPLFTSFHSGEIPAGNRSRLVDAAMDALLEQGRDVVDNAVRSVVYGDVQEIVVRNLPLVTLYHARVTYAKRPGVKGEALAFSWILLDLREATLDE